MRADDTVDDSCLVFSAAGCGYLSERRVVAPASRGPAQTPGLSGPTSGTRASTMCLLSGSLNLSGVFADSRRCRGEHNREDGALA